MLDPVIQVVAGCQADILIAGVKQIKPSRVFDDRSCRDVLRIRCAGLAWRDNDRPLLPLQQIAADVMRDYRRHNVEQVANAIPEDRECVAGESAVR